MNTNIKTIFSDIDGVIIGTRDGFNFPQPHPDVVAKFKQIGKAGVKITLCTAKAYFCVEKTIALCELNAYHITDGGAVIYNPFTKEVHTSEISRNIVEQLLNELEKTDIYTEVYTLNEYYVTKTDTDITEKHTKVLGKPPVIEPNFSSVIEQDDVIKIMFIISTDKQVEEIEAIAKKFDSICDLSWGIHPTMLPLKVAWFTAKGITKKSAVAKIMELEKSSAENSLGIGDSTGDWNFMQLCKYVATLENGTPEIKELVRDRGADGVIAESVEKNGMLTILSHFIHAD